MPHIILFSWQGSALISPRLTWSPEEGLWLEWTPPRLHSAAAANPECSGHPPLLCKSHHSSGLLLPVRHGWTEAVCLHRNQSLFNHEPKLQMHCIYFFMIRKYTNCDLQFSLNRMNHLVGVNSNSPYLGSFNLSGLKNLILPSFNPSIRWLYGCAAEGNQIITHICDATNSLSVSHLSITADTQISHLHTQTCSPTCCKAWWTTFILHYSQMTTHTKMVNSTWRTWSYFIHLSSCCNGKEFCMVMQHRATCSIYAEPVQPSRPTPELWGQLRNKDNVM